MVLVVCGSLGASREPSCIYFLGPTHPHLSHGLDEGGHDVDPGAVVEADGAPAEKTRRHLRLHLRRSKKKKETNSKKIKVLYVCMYSKQSWESTSCLYVCTVHDDSSSFYFHTP